MTDICIDLTKKAEQVTFLLEKKGVTNAPTMRVCAALDISGSMDDEIKDGSLQRAVDQLGGIAIKFDDNNAIDVWKFDNNSDYVGTWTPDAYSTYVKDNGIRSRGGTAYSPFIRDIRNTMFEGTITRTPREEVSESKGFFGFGKKKIITTVYDTVVSDPTDNSPVLVLAITDGEPYGDPLSRILDELNECAKHPMFFVFVGVSNQGESFKTLQQIASKASNASFVKLNGFMMKDEEVYSKIIDDKLVNFINKF